MARCATSRKAARLERKTKVSRVDDGRAPIAGGDSGAELPHRRSIPF